MPAKDFSHDIVVHALVIDGWTITHDPLTLSYGGRDLYVDLGAERTIIAAEKNSNKIAIEVKSFIGLSPVRELETSIGQYEIYQSILAETESERLIYLAVPLRIYESIFTERFGQLLLRRIQLRLIIFDEESKEIVRWIR